MDPLKEAFSKIKEDIFNLRTELSNLRTELNHLKSLKELPTTPTNIQVEQSISTDKQTNQQTVPIQNESQFTQINQNTSENRLFSIGNRGVPTNRQTDKPTDQQINELIEKSPFKKANEALSSLDVIKKEIRLKFKRLTNQEMLVFTTLYGLESQKIEKIAYKDLAEILNLSESSIRDYIHKLTQKGVPIEKIRQNNKKILLKISPDLKNIATLDTIIRLREL